MNVSALKKIAQDNNGTTGGDGSGANVSSGSVVPWLGAGASALLAHWLMSRGDDDKEKKKKETTWDKVLKWLTVAGAGAGGYFLGKSFMPSEGNKAYDPKEIDKIKLDADDTVTKRKIYRGINHAARTAQSANAVAGAWRTLEPLFRRTTPTYGWGDRFHLAGRNSLQHLIAALPIAAVSYVSDNMADKYDLEAKENNRQILELMKNR